MVVISSPVDVLHREFWYWMLLSRFVKIIGVIVLVSRQKDSSACFHVSLLVNEEI